MKILLRISAVSLLFFSLISCGSDIASDSGLSPQEIAQKNQLEIEQWLAANPGVDEIRSPSGLVSVIIEEGNGVFPTVEDTVTIDFDLLLGDGTPFTSTASAGVPAILPVMSLVPGLQEGIQLLSVGGSGSFLIPAALGFDQFPDGISNDDLLIYNIILRDINFQFAGQEEQMAIDQYLAENNLVADTITPSGLHFINIEEGNGESPTINSTVTVDYLGTLLDGTIFDTTRDRGNMATFELRNLIEGWQEGITLMSRGGTAIMILPSAIAYGNSSPAPIIPPNSVLVFEVTLIDFEG